MKNIFWFALLSFLYGITVGAEVSDKVGKNVYDQNQFIMYLKEQEVQIVKILHAQKQLEQLDESTKKIAQLDEILNQLQIKYQALLADTIQHIFDLVQQYGVMILSEKDEYGKVATDYTTSRQIYDALIAVGASCNPITYLVTRTEKELKVLAFLSFMSGNIPSTAQVN